VADIIPSLPTDEYAVVIADYRAMCALLGPLEWEAFGAGYAEYGAWRAARESRGSSSLPVECRRAEQVERASHAS
jgi:hypothetical protein